MAEPLTDPQPTLVSDLFPEILECLLALLSQLDAEAWNAPTVCAGWSVKDVALHLLGVEIGNISSRRDRFSLGTSLSDWDELVAALNAWNQEWVAVARRISAPLLIELLGFAGEKAAAYFRSLDPFETGGPVGWAGPEPRPVWLDVAREYTERWHHQQHIRDAVNRPGLKGTQYLRPVIETFTWALPHTFRHVLAPQGTHITLSIAGDAGGHWTLRREQGAWAYYGGTVTAPDAEIHMDQDTAWRLFTRGLDRDQARRRITIAGDARIAEPVFDMVAIIA